MRLPRCTSRHLDSSAELPLIKGGYKSLGALPGRATSIGGFRPEAARHQRPVHCTDDARFASPTERHLIRTIETWSAGSNMGAPNEKIVNLAMAP
jgi:hypothetical protein